MTTDRPTFEACCRAAEDSEGFAHGPRCLFGRGLAAGRAQVAEAIRSAPYPNPSPCLPAWHAGYTEATEAAARLAEGVSTEGTPDALAKAQTAICTCMLGCPANPTESRDPSHHAAPAGCAHGCGCRWYPIGAGEAWDV